MAEKPPFPLLILSDAPSASSGLGRICRDLATRIHERMSDVCKVATLGYGGPGSCKLGFQQYTIEGMSDWVVPTLPEVWKDFAGEEKGAVLSIWDASRLAWYAQPERSEQLRERIDAKAKQGVVKPGPQQFETRKPGTELASVTPLNRGV